MPVDALIRMFLGACLAVALAAAAPAQDYPLRPITLVVPYPAGGGNDLIARVVAEKMSAALGQPMVIENRGGAGGTIATRQVARVAADGYTLLVATSSLAINPSIYPNVGYDPRADFSPIGLMAASQNVLLVHPSVAAASVGELIARAKEAPGRLTFASTGGGNSVQLAAELFASMAGVTLTQVPYKGNGPALSDLLGGHVAIMFSPLPGAVGLVKDSKVRALAVTGGRRSPLFPDLPTIAEAGLPGYGTNGWFSVVVAAGTPRPIIDKLNGVLMAYLKRPDVQDRLNALAITPLTSTPEELEKFIPAEIEKWAKVVKDAGIEPQ